MAKKKKVANKRDADWARAKRLCRLSAEDVRMAKELGFSARNLIKNIPSPTQPWKMPVKDWIRDLYQRKMDKAAKKRARQKALAPWEEKPFETRIPEEVNSRLAEDAPQDGDDVFSEPADPRVRRANHEMQLRQQQFRRAAGAVAQEFAKLEQVRKIVLFGSVAAPLEKEVPRFCELRRRGIAIDHECGDVDLAVWLSDIEDLKALQRARGHALNRLLNEENIGVAHHQVDVFLLDADSDQYLGRLCNFGQCPKGRQECLVQGCGRKPFLGQHEGFVLRADSFAPERSAVLFDHSRQTALEEVDDIPF